MKTNKILYWVFTAVLSVQFLISVGFYFFKTDVMKQAMLALGYPEYLVFPLGVAKLLAAISIIFEFNKTLKEWAYAGLFYNLLLAIFAHVNLQDGGYWSALFTLFVLVLSYWFWKVSHKKMELVKLKTKLN